MEKFLNILLRAIWIFIRAWAVLDIVYVVFVLGFMEAVYLATALFVIYAWASKVKFGE